MITKSNAKIDGLDVALLIKPGMPSTDPEVSVIFIHGFPFSGEMWRQQLDALPDQVQGIAYDIRGFGESETNHHFFSIDLFARDLLALMDHLAISKAVLCGISMGGYIALRFAELFPERVSGLILSDTNAVADSNEAKLKRFAIIEQVLAGGKEDFIAAFLKNVFSDATFGSNSSVVTNIEKVILSTQDTTICAALLALASRTDTTSILNRLDVPALIIRGAEDKLMTEAQALSLSDNIKFSDNVVIPNAGHLPNLENPGEFNHQLHHFLNKHFLS
ncbi:alpha/beta fold hydrolase [Desertivirga xinjiangensis]|uniref:alpha/beta fold hydrolase n=1 Tax=Desertivirga xinjiangensis TaxID=539206 RepID=UPI00210B359F|nr:alpha/beta fold hydrolase [Pedobacter xinjiangensis]